VKMDRARMEELLSAFPRIRVAVVGDFFLDKYLVIDRSLSEVSLETGLEAYQVVEKRCSPGAAGTVTSNLVALGAGKLYAVGVIGDDGEGYELRKGLLKLGVDIEHLLVLRDRFTPTYTKPMIREDGKEREINRMDIKNRSPLPRKAEDHIVQALHALLPKVDGIAISDQVQERNCGVITDRVREVLAEIGRMYPEKPIVVDSRERIGEFRRAVLKPNRCEAARAVYPEFEEVDPKSILEIGGKLRERAQRPVFVTMGGDGILVFDEDQPFRVPGFKVQGEIDIVGAGDSVMAGVLLTLCAGGTPREAAVVGNLVASITIQQIGTTGTASPKQVLERFEEWREQSSPRTRTA